MSKLRYAQVAYMPYAPIKEEFRIGNYEVWSYYKEVKIRVLEETTIKYLDLLFGRYYERKYSAKRGGYDCKIKDIFIITPLGFNLGQDVYSNNQINDIRAIVHSITFSAICELSYSSSSSDAFIFYLQNFTVGKDGIGIQDKYYSKLDMVKFIKPYNIPATIIKFTKTPLCDALGKALTFKERIQIKRLFRSIELFYHTATYGDMITNEHRILFLVMCFEDILGFENKIEFVKKIEMILYNYNPSLETRLINYKNIEKPVEKSKTSWWAFDLYNLRSQIIHIEEINWEVKKYGDVWARIKFGGFLLRKIVKTILKNESIWESTLPDIILESQRLDERLEEIVEDFRMLTGI